MNDTDFTMKSQSLILSLSQIQGEMNVKYLILQSSQLLDNQCNYIIEKLELNVQFVQPFFGLKEVLF